MKHKIHNVLVITATVVAHTLAVCLTAVFTAWLVLDIQALQLFADSLSSGLFDLNAKSALLHISLSACLWALIVIGYKLLTHKEADRPRRVIKRSAGVVTLETLIVLGPFLLLTCGLAQLSMLNIAGMMTDLAAYQGARAAMVWLPEVDMKRVNMSTSCGMNVDDSVCTRARTAAAFVLAPTAPSNYQLSFSQPNPASKSFKRARGAMVGAFAGTNGSTGYTLGNIAIIGSRGKRGTMENVSFSGALDTHRFRVRASRKVSNAYMSLETFKIIKGARVGVDFTYKYQIVFPVFGRIWGKPSVSGMYYSPIRRQFTLPAQANMR